MQLERIGKTAIVDSRPKQRMIHVSKQVFEEEVTGEDGRTVNKKFVRTSTFNVGRNKAKLTKAQRKQVARRFAREAKAVLANIEDGMEWPS